SRRYSLEVSSDIVGGRVLSYGGRGHSTPRGHHRVLLTAGVRGVTGVCALALRARFLPHLVRLLAEAWHGFAEKLFGLGRSQRHERATNLIDLGRCLLLASVSRLRRPLLAADPAHHPGGRLPVLVGIVVVARILRRVRRVARRLVSHVGRRVLATAPAPVLVI